MNISSIPEYNPRLAKSLNRIAIVFSIIVVLIVASLRKWHIETNFDFRFLAPFHSSLNAITGMGLLLGYYFIRVKNILWHKRIMIFNMCLSGLFLVSYVVYHLTTPETHYCHEGNIRMVYFFILITHVVLATFILPLVLFTFIRAYTGQIILHRKLARWAFPIWLYVAFTGPLAYLMLRSCM
ncbi:MAG: DUF420 domain-containing protein [Saprospiraceae bacterium]|nr:DUF420 domain-containing protein [Saprospiraceae bacterium]